VLSVIWGIPYFPIRVAVRDLSSAMLVFCRTGTSRAVARAGRGARRGAPAPTRWRCRLLAIEGVCGSSSRAPSSTLELAHGF
jgi:hypothetical protein